MLFQIYGETAGFQLLGWLMVFVGLILANEFARRTKWGGIAKVVKHRWQYSKTGRQGVPVGVAEITGGKNRMGHVGHQDAPRGKAMKRLMIIPEQWREYSGQRRRQRYCLKILFLEHGSLSKI